MIHFPATLTVSAPAGTAHADRGPAQTIRPSRITTLASRTAGAPVPSTSVAPTSATDRGAVWAVSRPAQSTTQLAERTIRRRPPPTSLLLECDAGDSEPLSGRRVDDPLVGHVPLPLHPHVVGTRRERQLHDRRSTYRPAVDVHRSPRRRIEGKQGRIRRRADTCRGRGLGRLGGLGLGRGRGGRGRGSGGQRFRGQRVLGRGCTRRLTGARGKRPDRREREPQSCRHDRNPDSCKHGAAPARGPRRWHIVVVDDQALVALIVDLAGDRHEARPQGRKPRTEANWCCGAASVWRQRYGGGALTLLRRTGPRSPAPPPHPASARPARARDSAGPARRASQGASALRRAAPTRAPEAGRRASRGQELRGRTCRRAGLPAPGSPARDARRRGTSPRTGPQSQRPARAPRYAEPRARGGAAGRTTGAAPARTPRRSLPGTVSPEAP